LIKAKFDLAISSEILLEYEEIIQQKYGVPTANALIYLLKELPNVHHFAPYYKWKLIEADPDDNKYTDCAIAGQADYLVTEDRHYSMLRHIPFPKVPTISIEDFTQLIRQLNPSS
jgi:predicted nucleic acid-binding protein